LFTRFPNSNIYNGLEHQVSEAGPKLAKIKFREAAEACPKYPSSANLWFSNDFGLRHPFFSRRVSPRQLRPPSVLPGCTEVNIAVPNSPRDELRQYYKF
jgi:hypothetical protein